MKRQRKEISTFNSHSQRTGVLSRHSDVSNVLTSNDILGATGMSHANKESVILAINQLNAQILLL